MSNTIAVIWDCDKTLIDGYMQDPIFEYYKVNGTDFWNDNNEDNTRNESMQGSYSELGFGLFSTRDC